MVQGLLRLSRELIYYQKIGKEWPSSFSSSVSGSLHDDQPATDSASGSFPLDLARAAARILSFGDVHLVPLG
jgi:hypothetical protein